MHIYSHPGFTPPLHGALANRQIQKFQRSDSGPGNVGSLRGHLTTWVDSTDLKHVLTGSDVEFHDMLDTREIKFSCFNSLLRN
jgi:hypothetical protein